MKLLSVVVTYVPDFHDLKKNIKTYLPHVDQLIVWENTPTNQIKYNKEELDKENGKLIFLGEAKNVGMGKALNAAARYAVENGFTHLLTMDQDSFFEKGMLEKFKQLIIDGDFSNVGAFGVNYASNDKLAYKKNSKGITTVEECITSGSIFPVELFREDIFFDEKLFIDAVDFEYCYRLNREFDKKTIIFTDVVLTHQLGYSDDSFLGKWTNNYSAFRTYYLLRNQLYIWRKYPEFFGFYKRRHFVIHYVGIRFFSIIFSEDDKKEKLKSFFKGLFKGLFDKIN